MGKSQYHDAKPWIVEADGEISDFMTFEETEKYARRLARDIGERIFIEGPSGGTYATVVTDALGRIWTDLTGQQA